MSRNSPGSLTRASANLGNKQNNSIKSCDEVGENLEKIAGALWKSCPKGIDELAGQIYCCPKSQHPFKPGSCTWRGTLFDCADAKCKPNEVTVARNGAGDLSKACDWGRKRLLCCEMDEDQDLLTCPSGMCKSAPDFCYHDPTYDWDEDEDPADSEWDDYDDNSGGGGEGGGSDGGSRRRRRDASLSETVREPRPHTLVARMGKKRRFDPEALIDSIEFLMVILSRAYPGPSAWTRGANGRQASGKVYV